MGEIAAICGEPLDSFEPTFAVLRHLRGGIAMWPDGDLSEGRKSFITVCWDCYQGGVDGNELGVGIGIAQRPDGHLDDGGKSLITVCCWMTSIAPGGLAVCGTMRDWGTLSTRPYGRSHERVLSS